MIEVFIMSGVPGSGKSFHAQTFAAAQHARGYEGIIFSADHWFMPDLLGDVGITFKDAGSQLYENAKNNYHFDPKHLAAAHQECMISYIEELTELQGRKTPFSIVVDNTNIHSYEIAPYYSVAEAFNAKVEIIRVESDITQCLLRNTHDVPENTIYRMYGAFIKEKEVPGLGWIPEQHAPWWKSVSV